MKKITIGLLGCAIGSSNMGCCALAYSLIILIERICKQNSIAAKYVLMDFTATDFAVANLAEVISIDPGNIIIDDIPSYNFSSVYAILGTIKRARKNERIMIKIKECDFVIDLTAGDSFSDIYGQNRFYMWARAMEAVEKVKIPLILGPQTYGPYEDERVKKVAKRIIENAEVVISRDGESADYLKEFCNKKIIVATDLAFELPFNQSSKKNNCALKIGINPSGLLCKKKNDMSELSTEMLTDYEEYLFKLIDWLKTQSKYEIHMIPHVGDEAKDCFGDVRGVIYHDGFNNPVEAKTLIAQMDIFIGARMHATIGAFSSGVVTIPVAYSRKFSGLYSGIGYTYLIDLRHMTTEQSLEKSKEYITNCNMLKQASLESMKIVDEKRTVNEDAFRSLILKYAH